MGRISRVETDDCIAAIGSVTMRRDVVSGTQQREHGRRKARVGRVMEFVFRRFPADGAPDVAEHELWLLPEDEATRKRRDLARVACETGAEAFLRGSGPIREIYIQHDPTLDDMLAAFLIERRLSGATVPQGTAAFCEYARIAREGRRPGSVPIEVSLEGMHAALRNLAGENLSDDLSGSEFIRQWRVLAERIFAAAEAGTDPFQTSIVADDAAFACPRSYLQDQKKVYRQDVENGERWIVRLPGGPPRASGLMLRQPKSLLWKHWARADEEAPLGGSYLFTAVCGEDGNWIFSTDPVHRQPIKGLADVLQAAELQAAGEEAKSDPWFDGKPFGHTLVAPPKRGSKLTSKEVLRIARQWARVKKAPPPGRNHTQLQWGMALAVVVALAVSISSLLRPPAPVDPFAVPHPVKDDGTFAVTGEDQTPMRVHILSIGVSDYAGDGLDLKYAGNDAVELADVFATHTGSTFRHMNVTMGESDAPLEEVVRVRLIANSVEGEVEGALPPTRENILNSLVWLEARNLPDAPTRNDLVIVTVSGHGMLDREKDYYLLAMEHQQGDDPRLHGISWNHELAKTLNRLGCTTIVILDTCHAGAVSPHVLTQNTALPLPQVPSTSRAGWFGAALSAGTMQRGSRDPEELLIVVEKTVDDFNQNPMGVLLLPACLSMQKANENRAWKHGALSLAVLEAMTVNPDNGDRLDSGWQDVDDDCLPRLPRPDNEGRIGFNLVEYYVHHRVLALTTKLCGADAAQSIEAKKSKPEIQGRLIPLANRNLPVEAYERDQP